MYVIESTNIRKNGRWVPVLYLLVFRKEISPQLSQVSSALVLCSSHCRLTVSSGIAQ